MTTPNGAIVFNTGSGSDTLSSGLGPAIPVNGSGASTDGTAVVTGITTTGASAGDLLWVQTASGRQFSIIASVDSSTQVTCDDTFSAGLGQTWAIGGKRATWDNANSRQLIEDDVKAGWIIETETDQTLTSGIDPTVSGDDTGGWIVMRGSAGVSQPVINMSGATFAIWRPTSTTNLWGFENLKFTNSNPAKSTDSVGLAMRGTGSEFIYAKDCIFGDATNQLYSAVRRAGGSVHFLAIRCLVEECTNDGSQLSSSHQAVWKNCVARNNAGCGLSGGGDSVFENCISYGNTGDGFRASSGSFLLKSIAYNNGGAGVTLRLSSAKGLFFSNNIFVNNTGYGIDTTLGTEPNLNIGFENAFYNNAGNQTGMAAGEGDITLTADPFTDAAGNDFTLNDTAGGGAVLKAEEAAVQDTTTRPFRWLDTSTGGTGATNVAAAKFTRLE